MGPMTSNPRRRCGCYKARFLHNLTCGRKDPRNLEGTAYRVPKMDRARSARIGGIIASRRAD